MFYVIYHKNTGTCVPVANKYHRECITVNTRYRHTLGTPKKSACIVIVPASDNRDTGTYMPVLRESQIFALRIRVFGGFFRVFLIEEEDLIEKRREPHLITRTCL